MIALEHRPATPVTVRLELVFTPGPRGTSLAHSHVAAPLKIVRPFELDAERALVQILTLGPGLCAGDHYTIEVTDNKCNTTVTTTVYIDVYPIVAIQNVQAAPEKVCEGKSATLTATTTRRCMTWRAAHLIHNWSWSGRSTARRCAGRLKICPWNSARY